MTINDLVNEYIKEKQDELGAECYFTNTCQCFECYLPDMIEKIPAKCPAYSLRIKEKIKKVVNILKK